MRDAVERRAALVAIDQYEVDDGAALVAQGLIHIVAFAPAFRGNAIGLAHLLLLMFFPDKACGHSSSCKRKQEQDYASRNRHFPVCRPGVLVRRKIFLLGEPHHGNQRVLFQRFPGDITRQPVAKPLLSAEKCGAFRCVEQGNGSERGRR